MGIFDWLPRAQRAARARANSALGRFEDEGFEGSLQGSLQAMRAELGALSTAAADATAAHTRLQREQERLMAQAEEWRDKARQALQNGREDLARAALGRAKDLQARGEEMATDLIEAASRARELRERLDRLRQRLAEADRTAAALAARRQAAAAQKKVARALGTVPEADGAFATLSRLERQVEEEEAIAQAYADIVASDRAAGLALPEELEQSSAGSELDDELRALQEEMKRNQGGS